MRGGKRNFPSIAHSGSKLKGLIAAQWTARGFAVLGMAPSFRPFQRDIGIVDDEKNKAIDKTNKFEMVALPDPWKKQAMKT